LTGFLSIGYLAGFTLARLEYLSFYGVFCNANGPPGTGAVPGECYYYLKNPFKTGIFTSPLPCIESEKICGSNNLPIGMMLHLCCILPASLLVCFQFVPAIRYKLILFHRLNGYVVILLSLISSAGTIIIAKHAFGGDFVTQTFTGALVILTTVGFLMAWINIQLLQIDQHRAWMIRTEGWVSNVRPAGMSARSHSCMS